MFVYLIISRVGFTVPLCF